MSEAFGEALSFGLGVTLSPLAFAAMVLMLVKPGGRGAALAFLAAWVASLAVVAIAVLLLADGVGASESDGPADWAVIAQLLVAVLLIGVGARQWSRRRDVRAADELPGWIAKVDGLTTRRAMALAVLLASGKPKNLLLSVGFALAIAELGVSSGRQASSVAAFVLVATLAPALPLAVSVLMRERGTAVLERVRAWMIREDAAIIAVLCALFAVKLIAGAAGAITD